MTKTEKSFINMMAINYCIETLIKMVNGLIHGTRKHPTQSIMKLLDLKKTIIKNLKSFNGPQCQLLSIISREIVSLDAVKIAWNSEIEFHFKY